MKKIVAILRVICSIIIVMIAFLFMIIEGRLVLSGDWTTYEFAIWGCIQYCLRLLLAIIAFGIGVFSLLSAKKQTTSTKQKTLYGAIALVGMSIVFFIFATNYIGELFLGISIMYLGLTVIRIKE